MRNLRSYLPVASIVALASATVAIIFIVSSPARGQSDDRDPGYAGTFGYGVVVASAKGYPAYAKFDPAQYRFEGGKFLISPGPSTTLDLRAILPKGMTVSQAVAKVYEQHPENLKYKVEDIMVFHVWFSHDTSGAELVNAKNPWPQRTTDLPTWGEPREQRYTVTDASRSWTGAAATWDELKGELWQIANAKPGQKLYVVYRVGYKYKTPGGQMESKWDPDLKKFVMVPSPSLLGFEYGEPLAVCTIEIAP